MTRRMTEEERREMLALLAAGTEVLVRALEGVGDAGRKPTPDCWSVLEIVEHVARVEEYLLARLLEAVEGEPLANLVRERRIRERGADRSRRVAAPEGVIPDGRYATVEEALDAYRAARAETVRYVERATGDLRAKITTHPILGQVNCYETLLMMAAHPRRHAQQIIETGSAPSPSC